MQVNAEILFLGHWSRVLSLVMNSPSNGEDEPQPTRNAQCEKSGITKLWEGNVSTGNRSYPLPQIIQSG